MKWDATHRPWPLPRGPWVMTQQWHDLLFAHWPISVEEMHRAVPEQLPLDTFDGQAWLGVVPFRMAGVRPRLVPPVPGLSTFPELNVRTYVTLNERPGVYFFSLEAANAFAVSVARRFFRLPYFKAAMSLQYSDGGWIDYHSQRTHKGAPPAIFEGRYRPTGDVYLSQPGTLENWLTERYALYTTDKDGHPYGADIHHVQWPLQSAEANIKINSMPAAHDLSLPAFVEPLLHFARRLDVIVWPLLKLGE